MTVDDDPVIHTAQVVVDGTRERARARGSDEAGAALDLALSAGGTTPEHLFGAAYAACLASSIATVARRQKIEPDDVSIEAAVALFAVEDGFAVHAALDVTLHGFAAEEAVALTRAAYAICPYARSGVPLRLRANGLPV